MCLSARNIITADIADNIGLVRCMKVVNLKVLSTPALPCQDTHSTPSPAVATTMVELSSSMHLGDSRTSITYRAAPLSAPLTETSQHWVDPVESSDARPTTKVSRRSRPVTHLHNPFDASKPRIIGSRVLSDATVLLLFSHANVSLPYT